MRSKSANPVIGHAWKTALKPVATATRVIAHGAVHKSSAEPDAKVETAGPKPRTVLAVLAVGMILGALI